MFALHHLITIFLILSTLSFASAQTNCDILIAGGTLAALAAAIDSPTTLKICLIQPTDRLGGQLGDQGVWHIDFNWLYQSGYPDNTTAYNSVNLHPFMTKITKACNTGNCWVSRNCFMYSCIQPFIQNELDSKIKSGNMIVYKDSVVKRVQTVGSTIKSVSIVSRVALKEDCRSVDQRIADWYSPKDSEYYLKYVTKLAVNSFAIDATQYGDLLALSNADFQQGTPLSSTCGQSIVFGIHQQYSPSFFSNAEEAMKEEKQQQREEDEFSLGSYTAEQVWRYRRLLGSGKEIKAGEVSLQNWNGPGNDYRDGYVFETVTEQHLADWSGGLNFTTLKQAEARSLRFHQWFKAICKLPLQITGKYFNSCNGLSRLPYIRDGRRSIGYQGFMIRSGDVTGAFIPNQKLTATPFQDRVCLGFYNMDVHSIKSCTYEPYPQNEPLPFFISARALTNRKVQNLIVSGRAMAQQFYASTATRTHTTEFSTGSASIIMATYMTSRKINSTWRLIDCQECIAELQQLIRSKMPLQWTIAGKQYPSLGQ